MGLNPSAWVIGPALFENDIDIDRRFLEMVSGGLTGVAGVEDFKVAPDPSGHNVIIPEGLATLRGRNASLKQGTYMASSDGDDIVPLPVPQANPYIVAVVLRVVDTQYGAAATALGAQYQLVPGTASGTPQPPSDATIQSYGGNLPGGWLRLADVEIKPADSGVIPSGQISDRRTGTGVLGVALDLNNGLLPINPKEGQLSYNPTTKRTHMWTGAEWQFVMGPAKVAGAVGGTPASGWAVDESGLGNQIFETPDSFQIQLSARRSGASITPSAAGSFTNTPDVWTAPNSIPTSGSIPILCALAYRTSTGGVRGGIGRYIGRAFQLVSGQPGELLQQYGTSGTYSLQTTIIIPKS